jgi:hypothetical protein
MTTDKPRVAACRHYYRYGRVTGCPAGLWTVTVDGRARTLRTWPEALDLANTIARATRPVEVAA